MLDRVHVTLARFFQRRTPGGEKESLQPLLRHMLFAELHRARDVRRRSPVADGGDLVVAGLVNLDERAAAFDVHVEFSAVDAF